jgi:DNA polymerase-3 subunit delta'
MAKRKSAETSASEEAGAPNPLHPRLTDRLFGHEAAEDLFLSAFNAGSLHHAWLLMGERGIGKATFAYRAARFLLSQEQAIMLTRQQVDVLVFHEPQTLRVRPLSVSSTHWNLADSGIPRWFSARQEPQRIAK